MQKITINRLSNNSVNIYFDKKIGKHIEKEIVFDMHNLRVRNASIDDRKTYKPHRQGKSSCCQISPSVNNRDEIIGEYEVELSECKKWYQLYLIKNVR